MGAAREAAQHGAGLVSGGGLAEHLIVDEHGGVGRDEYLVWKECRGVGMALQSREVGCDVLFKYGGGVVLLAVELRGEAVLDARGAQ